MSYHPAPTHPGPLDARLIVVPGSQVVLFLVMPGSGCSVLAVHPARFLEGMKAACDLLGFSEPQCFDDAPPEELLPWAGNV